MENYKKGGYEKRFIVQKANGEPTDPNADYFVLRLDKDPHALEALYTYALSIIGDNKQFSSDLMKIYRYYQGQRLPEKHIIREKYPKHPFK
jgi:hypothetical protein